MMKAIKTTLVILWATIILAQLFGGCSARHQRPDLTADSTIVYVPKDINDLSADITLCRKINKKTGKPADSGNVFRIRPDENVRAYVELKNRFNRFNETLMFHLDWIDPGGNSIFLKRIDLMPGDSSTVINSSISLNPESRKPGKHMFRIYLFRELIAEKDFELLPPILLDTTLLMNQLAPEITYSRSVDTAMGVQVDVDTAFEIKKKGRVHAFINLANRLQYSGHELKFLLEWSNPDSVFYRKQVVLPENDTTTLIRNSIIVTTETRKPGKYALKIYLFDKPVAGKEFYLVAEKEEAKEVKPSVRANLSFCSGVDKATGARQGVGTEFKIGNRGRIYAFADIEHRPDNNKPLKFNIEWTDPEGRSFYKKQVELLPDDNSTYVSSSISVAPDTRKPGEYQVKLYLSKDLIANSRFTLLP